MIYHFLKNSLVSHFWLKEIKKFTSVCVLAGLIDVLFRVDKDGCVVGVTFIGVIGVGVTFIGVIVIVYLVLVLHYQWSKLYRH